MASDQHGEHLVADAVVVKTCVDEMLKQVLMGRAAAA
jgi:hypothetical protein